MKQILTITRRVSSNQVMCKDVLNRTYLVDTDRTLRVGESVLVKNGIVVGTVKKKENKVYEV